MALGFTCWRRSRTSLDPSHKSNISEPPPALLMVSARETPTPPTIVAAEEARDDGEEGVDARLMMQSLSMDSKSVSKVLLIPAWLHLITCQQQLYRSSMNSYDNVAVNTNQSNRSRKTRFMACWRARCRCCCCFEQSL